VRLVTRSSPSRVRVWLLAASYQYEVVMDCVAVMGSVTDVSRLRASYVDVVVNVRGEVTEVWFPAAS
jgi:hypothetical protein